MDKDGAVNCPNCKEPMAVISPQRMTGQQMTAWVKGGYRCGACGLSGPVVAIEDIKSIQAEVHDMAARIESLGEALENVPGEMGCACMADQGEEDFKHCCDCIIEDRCNDMPAKIYRRATAALKKAGRE